MKLRAVCHDQALEPGLLRAESPAMSFGAYQEIVLRAVLHEWNSAADPHRAESPVKKNEARQQITCGRFRTYEIPCAPLPVRHRPQCRLERAGKLNYGRFYMHEGSQPVFLVRHHSKAGVLSASLTCRILEWVIGTGTSACSLRRIWVPTASVTPASCRSPSLFIRRRIRRAAIAAAGAGSISTREPAEADVPAGEGSGHGHEGGAGPDRASR